MIFPSLRLVGPIPRCPGFVSSHSLVRPLQVTFSTPSRDASNPLSPSLATFDVNPTTNKLFFSSEAGGELLREVLRDLWPHTPRDYQIEAVARLLDGIDVLAILPTGAGKTAILTMFMLVLDYIRLNSGRFPSRCGRFPEEPIMVVVYPTNCLEEEQVCIYSFRDKSFR